MKKIIGIILSIGLLAASVSLYPALALANERNVEYGAILLAKKYSQSNDTYQLMSVDELKSALDAKEDLLLVGTMDSQSYKKEHIPGTVPFMFPSTQMDQWDTEKIEGKTKEQFFALLGSDYNRKIVIHCNRIKCPRASHAIEWAVKEGYKNLYYVPGGTHAWRDSGYELVAE